MIDVGRLKHDRDYWDSVAPEGADLARLLSSEDGSVEWFMGQQVWHPKKGEWWPSFRGRENHNYDHIPRPARKQWSGPEDGLPPIGTECEVYGMVYGSSGDMKWKKVTVHAHVDGRALAESTHQSGTYVLYTQDECRPLKSEKERVVEAALLESGQVVGCHERDKELVDSLYDSGFLKMPEEDQ